MSRAKSDRASTRMSFNTTIDKRILEKFKERCMDYGLQMNTILEMFMEDFSKDQFIVEMSRKSGCILKYIGNNENNEENN